MKNRDLDIKPLLGTIVLANILWFATFYLEFSSFWIKITVSASILAVLAVWVIPEGRARFNLNAGAVIMGLFSAAALYFIFWAGREISISVFPFAEQQIGSIYGKGDGTSSLLIFPLLFLVTGPCEEIFWRGYLQEKLMRKYGNGAGWLLGTAVYAIVHIWSFNFMLIGAAAVAGAFWGLMYWRYRDLAPVIISHSAWSAFIFTIQPLT